MEYWGNEILRDVGKGLGNLIYVDPNLEDRVWGAYARLCIDIFPHQNLPSEIELHFKDGIQIQKIEKEDFKIFCPKCKSKLHDKLDCNGVVEIVKAKQYTQKLPQHMMEETSSSSNDRNIDMYGDWNLMMKSTNKEECNMESPNHFSLEEMSDAQINMGNKEDNLVNEEPSDDKSDKEDNFSKMLEDVAQKQEPKIGKGYETSMDQMGSGLEINLDLEMNLD
ncbi:hypothetical protein SUGI_0254540 [Cryptomeria japonica]|nr:hypothetical protein SUGI_0254540 [Cryptomeria japonica]